MCVPKQVPCVACKLNTALPATSVEEDVENMEALVY